MERAHFRPRLVLLVTEPRDVVRSHVAERLAGAAGVEGRIGKSHFVAWIAGEDRRFWSPSLDVHLRHHPRGTLLVGRFGPHPSLFTLYVFAAIGLSFLGALAISWGLVQHILDEPPYCLLGLPLAGVAAAGLWATSRLGLSWGWVQVVRLAAIVDGLGEVCDDEVTVLAESEALRTEASG